jgi:tetratricopeptide (TPR) repeat protein
MQVAAKPFLNYRGCMWRAFWAMLAVSAYAAALPSDGLQIYRELDEKQRLHPQNKTLTKAWLDEAARLATVAADQIERRQYRDAATLLRATERPLSHAPSWNNLRGYSEFKLGNAKPALYYLQRALQLDPQNEDYLFDLGEFLGYHRAHDEAVRIFEVAAKRMPLSPRVTTGLAISYILQNRADEAQKLLESLISTHPRFEPAYRALGECYEGAGNSARMLELGRTLQIVNPSNAQGWYLEAAGLFQEGRTGTPSLDGAIIALQKTIQLERSHTRAHFLLAKAFQEAGNYDRAIDELNQTLRLDPDHERAHYVLAQLYQRAGETQKARLEFEKHKQIKDRDRNIQYRRLLISIRDNGTGRNF